MIDIILLTICSPISDAEKAGKIIKQFENYVAPAYRASIEDRHHFDRSAR